MLNILLEGEKVWLCEIDKDNPNTLNKCLKWMNDTSIKNWLGHSGRFTTIENEKEYLKKVHSNPDNHQFAIIDKATETYIGNCDLTIKALNTHSACIGICIGEHDFMGKGCGSDAIKLLLKHAFMDLGLHSVYLNVCDDNSPAINCYSSCGFKISGTMRDHLFYDGSYHNTLMMDILDTEYFALHKTKKCKKERKNGKHKDCCGDKLCSECADRPKGKRAKKSENCI